MRRPSWSKRSTYTSISSPTLSTSRGCLTRCQANSLMWIRPSAPPRSTNAPKSRSPLTTPRRVSPSFKLASNWSLLASRNSRCASRWLSTKRRRRRFTSITFTAICWPIMLRRCSVRSSSFSPRGKFTTWLAGTKPRKLPKGTIKPPRLASAISPSMIVPAFISSSARIQSSFCLACATETIILPSSSSVRTIITAI